MAENLFTNLLKPYIPLISGLSSTAPTAQPKTPAPVVPAPTSSIPAPATQSTPAVPNMSTINTPAPAPYSPAPTIQSGGPYTVQSGDTLSAIAARNNVSLSQLLDMNPQYRANPNLIKPGEVVNFGSTLAAKAPATPSVAPSAPTPTTPGTVTMPSGAVVNPATGALVTGPNGGAAPAGSAAPAPAKPSLPDIASVLAEIDKYSQYSPEEEATYNKISNIESGLGIQLAGEANRPIPLGFITGRQKAEEARALALQKPLTAQATLLQAKRIASLEAAKAKLGIVSPQKVSAGESIVDPITGKTIVGGTSLSDKNALDTFFNLAQTYPDANISWDENKTAQQNLQAAQQAAEASPSFQAKQTVYAINPLTGEPVIINKRTGGGTGGGGGTNFGGGTTGAGITFDSLAPEIKASATDMPELGLQFFDASKATSAQLPYIQRASQQTGIPILSKDDANKIQETYASFKSANALVDQIKTLTGTVLTAPDDVGSQTAQAARLKAIEIAPYLSTDNDAKQFISVRNSVLSLLTRATGEKGVLTDQDVARIAQALPSYGDSATLAAKKAANFSNVLKANISGTVEAYVGQPVKGSSGGEGGNSSDPLGLF